MDFTTGFVGTNKEGLEYEIIDAKRMHSIRIRFKLDNAEVTTTNTYLKQGLPLHPTLNKYFVGKQYKDRDGNDFILHERLSYDSGWRIKFLKDNIEIDCDTRTIKEGKVRHPNTFVKVGDRFKVYTGEVTVTKVTSAIDINVIFDDGNVTNTTARDLRKGVVGHPMSGFHIGQKFKTNSGWEGEIIKYNSCHDVVVKWQDGSTESHPAGHIKNGGIKPVMQPSVADIGYVGYGKFSSRSKKNGISAPEEIYAYWQRMLVRCFNPNEIIKNSGRRYIFVNVHKDWHNFQNFAEWAIQQPNWNIGHELDKDLLGTGYEYSSENCTFLPADVNVFLAENWSKQVHDLPIGVQYLKPGTIGAKVGYVSRCHTDKGREYLGYFDDPMDAYFAYKQAKEQYARVLAEKFKPVITSVAYEKLKSFELTKVYSEAPHTCSSL